MPVEDVALWAIWDAVQCPVLVLRGEHSDLLSRETTEAMQRRGPPVEVVEIPDVGHAPTFMAAEHIALAKDWLRAEGRGD